MLFNSLEFIPFLALAFLLYWFVFNKTAKWQNIVLLGASVFFYWIADWKFISLLAVSGFVNYFLAKRIAQEEDESTARKTLFYLGIVFNIGILFYFKYFNFFIQSFVDLFNYGGADIAFTPFHILLPLGISFFTFQLIGYLIDVNNEEIEPNDNLLNFFTYLAYFPKILSGPIERLQNFIPQIEKKRTFDYQMATDGVRQFLWGLFKKVVIADNCTYIVNGIFDNYSDLQGSTLLLGSAFYIISIYADFSGFSDMACGVSKLFNIKITNNFAFPFFATNISEYWKRWHISLTTWMMTYIYSPLSFILRGYKKMGVFLSILLTFLLVGLWHGDNLTFIVFGVLHGLYFIPLILKGSAFKTEIVSERKYIPTFKDFASMLGVFLLSALTAIFFKVEKVSDAFDYFGQLFSKSLLSLPDITTFSDQKLHAYTLFFLLFVFFLIEWLGREGEYGIANVFSRFKRPIRWAFYSGIIFLIGMFMQTNEMTFIYFQF